MTSDKRRDSCIDPEEEMCNTFVITLDFGKPYQPHPKIH